MSSILGSSLCEQHCLSSFSWAHFHSLLTYFLLFQERYRVQLLVLFLPTGKPPSYIFLTCQILWFQGFDTIQLLYCKEQLVSSFCWAWRIFFGQNISFNTSIHLMRFILHPKFSRGGLSAFQSGVGSLALLTVCLKFKLVKTISTH